MSVRDVVAVGRFSHVGMVSRPGAADYEVVEEVLDELGIGELADRVYTELSGGERQMVLIARALAQQPEYLFMDENMREAYGIRVDIMDVDGTLEKILIGQGGTTISNKPVCYIRP